MNIILGFAVILIYKMFIPIEAILEWEQNLYPNQIFQSVLNSNFFRHELHVDEFVQDVNISQQFVSKGINQWLTVTNNGVIYLIGIRNQGITLVSMYRKQNNQYQLHELPIDLQENISCAATFTVWSNYYKRFENNVIIATESPSNSVYWYRIKNYNLDLVSKWCHGFHIKQIIHISKEHENLISFLEHSKDGSSLNFFGYSLKQNIPHIWFKESLPLEKHTTSVAVLATEYATVIATVQSNTKDVILYRSGSNCIRNCQFIMYAQINKINASKLQSFYAYGHKYIAINAFPTSAILSVDSENQLVPHAIFRGISELMIVNVPSAQGVIIVGRNSSNNVNVYTYSLESNNWVNHPSPPCHKLGEQTSSNAVNINGAVKCLGGKQWEGSAVIFASEQPSVVFAGNKIVIVHVICSLKTPDLQSSLDYLWLTSLRNNIEDGWNRFNDGMDSLLNTTAKSYNKNGLVWNNICDMKKEIDSMTHLLQNSRLKLNSIDCKTELTLTEAKSSIQNFNDDFLISYRFTEEVEQREEYKHIRNNERKIPMSKPITYPKPSKKSFSKTHYSPNVIATEMEENDNSDYIPQSLLDEMTREKMLHL